METHHRALFAVAALLLSIAPAAAAEDTPEATLREAVEAAIGAKDPAAFEKLMYCEGATPGGQEFSRALMETALEIDVAEVEVAPLPEGKTGPPTTMTVTHLLRITGKPGSTPARQMFPVGENDGRLYVACAMEAPAGFQ